MNAHDPLAIASQALSTICDAVDAAERIDEALQTAFNDAQMSLEYECDKRIAFDRWLKIQRDAAQEAYRFYRERVELLDEVHTKFKDRTKAAMLTSPNLPYRGKLGKISVVENQPSVDYAFGDKHVDDGIIDFYAVPAEYVKEKVSFEVDHAKVKADLLAGKEIGWAKIKPPSHHVRFPAAKKPKQIESGDKE